MNIKERIIAFYSDTNRTPYADLNPDGKLEFKTKIMAFLHANNFQNAEMYAKELKRHIFSLHAKQGGFEGALKDLYSYENNLNASWQRLHFVHQVNVFLLGHYLYDLVPPIRTAINDEMKRTSGGFLSDGNETGEFLFRWRMATIVHDLGYAISVSQEAGCLHEELETFTHVPGRQFDNVEDIYVFKGRDEDKDLLKQVSALTSRRMGISLCAVVDFLKDNNPYQGTAPFYDHGILSSVIFLQLINDLYDKHSNKGTPIIVAGRELVWNKTFLDGVFPEIAMAVALHNLDAKGYEGAEINLERYYALKNRPFAWLLKISDMLQEWDKPKTDVAPEDRRFEDEFTYDIQFEDSSYFKQGDLIEEAVAKIIVNDFPCKRGENSREKEILEGFRSSPIDIWVGPLKFIDA